MATRTSVALHSSNTAAADFRAWAQFVEDTLVTTGGWVVTADTGQLTISGASAPGAANTKVGYRIYRMNDTLQATAPVFMRIDYGSSNASAAVPGMWITIGTGSNGSGTITGILFNGGAVAAPTVASTVAETSTCDSYGSADTNRVTVLAFVRASANTFMLFSLERSKDASGNDTADGLLLAYSSASSGNLFDSTQYVIMAGGSQPPTETGVSFVISNRSSSAFSSNVGIGLPMYFKSVPQQPGMNVVIVNDGDFIAEAQFTMSIYGNTRTYQLGNSNTSQIRVPTGNAGATARANTRIGIRYD